MTERHIVTGEYPPDTGGVGDCTALLATALADAGERVHVWCPGSAGTSVAGSVEVHRDLGRLEVTDLERITGALDNMPRPPRLLVQWVPHAFGRRSLNVGFCRWLLRRRRRGDEIDVVVHEPFLPFQGSLKARAAAAVHRLMTSYVLRSATRVWITTGAWEAYLRPYAPKRELGFQWLPVPSTIPVVPAAAPELVAPPAFLIGSFPTGEPYAGDVLRSFVVPILEANPLAHLLLIGRRGEATRADLATGNGRLADRVHATGALELAALSPYVMACDVAVQPYADGVCGRRTTAMAFLAHGRPLVTTDGRFTESLWREHAVALVPASAPRAVQQSVESLIANVAERERLARAGRKLYAARFDVRHAAAALHRAVS